MYLTGDSANEGLSKIDGILSSPVKLKLSLLKHIAKPFLLSTYFTQLFNTSIL